MINSLTPHSLAKILPANKEIDAWYEVLVPVLDRFGINTRERVAAFLAQCGHESMDFTRLSENLNYSQKGLLSVFRKYFPTEEIAAQYARQPEKIANKVYSNRMGNGDELSGDGWKFRGRGVIQITGKNNYTSCSMFLFQDSRLIDDPSYLETKQGAIESACWYWMSNNLNKYADAQDLVSLTKRINGGLIGYAERSQKYKVALSVL